MRLLKRAGKPVFFDVDDAVMFDSPSAGWIGRQRMWRRFLATARHVDRVVAGNDYLAEMFLRHGTAAATILPTVVDPAHYQVKSHGRSDRADEGGGNTGGNPVRLVWIGSRSTLPYLRRILPAISEAAKTVPGLSLVTIGDKGLGTCPLLVEHIDWSVDGEAAALVRGDIGIAPTPADRWTLGKCGFKIIQYMAAGLPVIASPVGANAQIVGPEQTGLLPATDADWPRAIARLAGDAALRANMGAAGRAKVEREYSLDYAAEVWAGLLG
jgi:glycosyltransferase involved in cell wall biosynthesis